MKVLTTLLLTVLAGSLQADSNASSPPADTENCDKSPNCKVCKKKRESIAMNGDTYDNTLSNEANRAAENGNTEREQRLLNREQSAEIRQDQRENTESSRTHGRR